MHLITYISTAKFDNERADDVLRDIGKTAKLENGKRNITGVLFLVNDKFLQVLEGEEAILRDLMRNIEADERHGEITYLIDTEVEKRGFNGWDIDNFHLNNCAVFTFENLKNLTESFQKNLLPRSDALVDYYKILLGQKTGKKTGDA